MGDDVLNNLEREYCPPLDTALFYAILSDYDVSNVSSIQQARTTLEALKDNATNEGDNSFDPSGSTRPDDAKEPSRSSAHSSSERARSWHGDATSESTEMTNLSHGLDSLSFDAYSGVSKEVDQGAGSQTSTDNIETLSEHQKKAKLYEMFPTIKPFDIGYVLKKAHQDFDRAVEELLNQSFLELEDTNGDESILKKGIDGFLELDTARGRKPKGKRRKRQTRRTSSTPAISESVSNKSVATLSRWDRAKEDVEFLAQRINLPTATISSAYHASGASLPSAIAMLCTFPIPVPSPHIAFLDEVTINAHAAELALDFPILPPSTAKSLVLLTHPSTASAHELARAALVSPTSSSDILVPQYLPRTPSPPSDPRQSMPKPLVMPFDTASRQAYASATARANAFTQASAAYRKSKSKPLMGAAASYYSSVGRDATASLRKYEAAAADARVTAQSRAGEIDLHGVNVKDAVRIAQDHVEQWWVTEGQEWARAGRAMGGRGLRIVTGVGRHSEGGRGKLGPAVGAMLVREGWKVEIEQGVIQVVGKTRR